MAVLLMASRAFAQGGPGPDAASTPGPAHGATGVSVGITLNWVQTGTFDSMEIYFGPSMPPRHLATATTSTSFKPTEVLPSLFPLTTYYWQIVTRRGSLTASSPLWSFTTSGYANLRFVPVTPCRLVDTREDRGEYGKPSLAAGSTRTFRILERDVATACGVRLDAFAYSLNVTVVPKEPLGYLTIWPTGSTQPFVSTLNSVDGRVKANAAIVPAGFGGSIDVFVTNATDLVLDINGYFLDPRNYAAALAFYPLQPCRVSDTRNPSGLLGGPIIAAGTSRSIPFLASNCAIPANAQAYSINATVVPTGPLGYLTLWPTGQAQPFVSTLNAPTGSVVANAAIIPAGTNGEVSAFVTNQTHLVIDINGYFAPPGAANGLRFFPVTPCRILDTRNAAGEFGGPVLAANETRSYRPVETGCNIPPAAAAYVLNATVVPTGALGYLTLWPTSAPQPFVSTLNAIGDPVVANMAIVPAGQVGGGLSSFVTNQTHLILDTNGYFAP